MTRPPEPPDRIPGERTPFADPQRTPQHAESIPVPENFRGYPFTFISNLGRAALSGANIEERAIMARALFDGFVRRNEYNPKTGEQTFGPVERRQGRDEYLEKVDEVYARLPREQRDRVDMEFDWDKWREEYDAVTAAT